MTAKRETDFPVIPRKAFLLRIDPAVLKMIQRWADDDLRSLNGQIEFLLRKALAESGRVRQKESGSASARKEGGS
jgi:hypothetical protein